MATNIDVQGTPVSGLSRETNPAGVDVPGVKSGRTVKVSLNLLATKDDVNNIDNNRKGYFSTSTELNASYPVPKTGWYAYVGSTGTIWKTSGGAWVNTGNPIPDDVDLSLCAKKNDLAQLERETYDKFLPDRSFSGGLNIDYNHLVNLDESGNFYRYNGGGEYDCGWVLIFEATGTLEITGVKPSMIAFFSKLEPSAESFISSSYSNKPTIPDTAKLALVNFNKVNNSDGYLSAKIIQQGAGATNRDVSILGKKISVSSSFSGYPDVVKGKMGVLNDSGNYSGYIESTTHDSVQVGIIAGSEKLTVKGGNSPSRFIFFNSYDFSSETYIGNNTTGIVTEGARFCIINFKKTDNLKYDNLRIEQQGMGADKKQVDKIVNDALTLRPKGKNYLNPAENLIGRVISINANGNAVITANGNGIMSNKLYLENEVFMISPDIIPNPASDYVYIAHMDATDIVLSHQRFVRSTQLPLEVILPDNYAYSRLSLKNTGTAVYNPETAQFELGSVPTDFEEFKGLRYAIPGNKNNDGYHPNMMLFGNSTAYSGNTWFLDACRMLGVTGYNKATSGQLVYVFANGYKNRSQNNPYGTVFTKEEFNKFDVLVLCYSGTPPVHLEDGLRDKVEDYAGVTFSGSNGHYSDSWDYILKQYTKDCYDARLDPESRWYGTQEGKPCYIIVCTWPCDSRTTYNKSVRILQKKWGFFLMNFDENSGFSSKVALQDLITPTDGYPSFMKGVLNSNFDINPSEPQNNVVNMWHQSRLPNSPIQKRMAYLFAMFVRNGMRNSYGRVDSHIILGQCYTKDGYAIRSSDGQDVLNPGFSVTDFILLDKSQDLEVDACVNAYNDNIAPIAFYDGNKNYLGCEHNNHTYHTTESNYWWSDYRIPKKKFNTGGEFENAVYFKCTDNVHRKGEIKNTSLNLLLAKLTALCEALNIDINTL